MAVVNFNIRNTKTEKVYPISAPVGERIDTASSTLTRYIDLEGVRYINEGTEENPQWVVSETLDYAFKRSYTQFFSYDEESLNGNYIELENEHELYDSDYWNNNSRVTCEIMGTGGRLNLALWTETEYTPEPVTRLHTSFQGAGNAGWYRPIYGYPPGVIIATTTDFSAMNPIWVQDYYAPDGKKPKISFNVETAQHGEYLYPILVVSGWCGHTTTIDGETVVVYGIIWQRAISLSFAFGSEIVMPQKTPSKTPNTTPAGGQGARNNYSYDTPMPTASGLSGLNYFSSSMSPGLHLYKIDSSNWGKLLSIMWASDWLKKISQAVTSFVYGSTKAPADYVISCTKIALPVTIEGEPATASGIYLGPVLYVTADPDDYPKGKHLSTRYAETDTYTFDIKPYSQTYLDYDPYTKIQVHLPFCGTVSVSADSCIGGQIEVKYIVDLVTGGCCGIVRCVDQFGNSKIASVVSGQCGISIPFVASEHTLDKVMGAIGSIAAGAASGSPVPVLTGAAGLAEGLMPYSGAKTQGVSTAGGAAAVLGDRSLYVTVMHPQDITGFNDDNPPYQIDNYGNKLGYPAAWFGTLQQLRADALSAGQSHAYCECIADPAPISDATDTEKDMIKQALQGGVYL